MSNEAFDGQILTDKLLKLNNSQQSIESLSSWCISNRKKAKQIVETWDNLFNSSQRERRVSFLYLANDILQNSRRKGSEFVNEFWKVLPAALKVVYGNGDENGKKAVSRLVNIWEERKVFGSRGRSLKDEMLGNDPLPSLVTNGKSSNPIKIVKKDANSLRIKLAVGGMPEKIVSALQSVYDEHVDEEAAFNKCNAAGRIVGTIEKDIGNTSFQEDQQVSALAKELQEQENILVRCVGQLENAEATRVAFVFQLKEVLQDQESKLELIRSQLQVARGHGQQASNLRQRLTSPLIPAPTEPSRVVMEPNLSSPQPLLTQPLTSFATSRTTTEEDSKKAAAAAVAAKLAASTSSAQMLTSILSSLVAEEAASKSGGLNSTGFSTSLPIFPPEKRPKLEKPMTMSDTSNSDGGNTAFFPPLQPPQQITSISFAPTGSSLQAPFPPLPPPPPPLPPGNPPATQYPQSTPLMMSYGYSANGLPPPPPLPSHIARGITRPTTQPPQQPPSQQQPATGGFYRPPGIGFYGQTHQQTTPGLPHQ